MLKIVSSKPKLRKLFEFSSIDGELDTIWWKYDANGITQKQVDPSFTVAVISKINKSFFTEYQADGEGEIKISSTLIDILRKYFKEVETIELNVEDNNLTLKSKDEVYEGSILQVELPVAEINVKEEEYGFIPELKGGIKGAYGIDSEDWAIKASEIKIHYGNTLKLSVALEEEGGKYTRGVKILEKKNITGEGEVTLDGKMFNKVIELFSGPLYLIITEGPIVLTQKTSEYTISYVVAPKVEE
jgi:hypothetical protein